jgi:hypothetical protein
MGSFGGGGGGGASEAMEDALDPVVFGDLVHLRLAAVPGSPGGFLSGDGAYCRCGVQVAGDGEEPVRKTCHLPRRRRCTRVVMFDDDGDD